MRVAYRVQVQQCPALHSLQSVWDKFPGLEKKDDDFAAGVEKELAKYRWAPHCWINMVVSQHRKTPL